MTSKKETGNINAKLNKSSTNFSLLGKEYSLFDNNHKTISCLSLYLSLCLSPFSIPGSLSGLLHLHEMDLSDNNLHFVQHGVLEDLYFLSLLKLGGNPWVCNYRWAILICTINNLISSKNLPGPGGEKFAAKFLLQHCNKPLCGLYSHCDAPLLNWADSPHTTMAFMVTVGRNMAVDTLFAHFQRGKIWD